MSQLAPQKYFENPYMDYDWNPDKQVLLNGHTLLHGSKVSDCVEAKWTSFNRRIKQNINQNQNDTSVYIGTAGIALVYVRMSSYGDKKHLLIAKDLAKVTRIDKSVKESKSFICGVAGPLAIRAIICFKLGETQEMQSLLADLLSFKDEAVDEKSHMPHELLYGRAGYLYALLFVNKHISPPPVEENVLKQIANVIIAAGISERHANSLMYKWHEYYLGAAHGLAGIFYILLQVHHLLDKYQLNELLKRSIDYLATMRLENGNYPAVLMSDSDDKMQWCHGAPGFVFLFAEAFKVFNDEMYLQLALEAGELVWKRGLLWKGYSLCHGVSGNAYCFLKLYQTTQDQKHLYRAIKFAEWCIDYTTTHERHSPDHPLSLFEGISGPMYLLIDIQRPMEAKFPGFML